MRNTILRIAGISALILGFGISVYGYRNLDVPICAPCPPPETPGYTYFGLGLGVAGALLLLSGLMTQLVRRTNRDS